MIYLSKISKSKSIKNGRTKRMWIAAKNERTYLILIFKREKKITRKLSYMYRLGKIYTFKGNR